jgi:predicted nucleotidyltransferase
MIRLRRRSQKHFSSMTPSPDDLAATAARDFARTLSAQWQSQLGGEIIGLYLIGSLAHGGFSRRYSDIDLAVVSEGTLAPVALDGLRALASGLSAELGPKVSVFWTDRSFAIGRFPPLDRADYLDYAVPLCERERIAPPRPSLDEVRVYLAGAPFTNWTRSAEAFAASDALAAADRKSYLRALLYPARFVASFMTGRMLSNDDAVASLGESCPSGLDTGLIRRALDCRRAAADPDALFPARALLLGQVAALERFMVDTVADWR